MKPKELKGDAAKPDSFERHSIDNAQDIMRTITTTPTTSDNTMKENDFAFRQSTTTMFYKKNGKVWKWTVSEST